MSTLPLTEVILSSTHATSPLPLTSVHSLSTGQVLFSFKSPPPPSTTTSTAQTSANAKGKQPEGDEAGTGQTMSFIEGNFEGVSSCLVGLSGKDGRALLNVWNFSRESTISRLIPPVRLNVIATSPNGDYLVGGTLDGRVFFWELSTGTLLITLDAHYRAITCLEFTTDGSCLITGSQDAGCSVWSVGRILNSTPMNPPTPFTTLSDHTLGITCIRPGLGTFPSSRVFTASKDGTVKIWDLSTSPASLLTTFQFPAPVQHLAIDPLERFFFVSIPTSTTSTNPKGEPTTTTHGAKVLRVNLHRESKENKTNGIVAIGGTGSIGELERVDPNSEENDEPGMSYTLSEPISALHLSSHSPTLLVSTSSTSQVHILSLLSLLPTRIISPPPASTPYGGLTFLQTFLYQPTSSTSSSGSNGGDVGVQREIASVLGRSVVGVEERERGGKGGRSVWGRIGEGSGPRERVEDLIKPVQGLSSVFNQPVAGMSEVVGMAGVGLGGVTGAGNGERETIERLERELEVYKKGLEKAKGVNERIWKSVVEGSLSTN
ncbi:hypothetical protein JCM16303_002861 [Sporobolomyces ruberrimus]